MKIFKKILCTFLVIIMCLTAAPLDGFVGMELPDFSAWFADKASAADELAATGQCGDDVYWSFDSATGELVISGTGEMWDYVYNSSPFYYNAYIKSIIIESDITSVGSYTFHNCTGLTSISFPNSMTSIGDYAFCYCTSLESLTIPYGVTEIGDSAFYLCWDITSVVIPNSVTSIGNSAFRKCRSITSISIPNSVISINDYTFAECEDLESITIPSSVTSIGYGAFIYCESLASVTIPNSVESIGVVAFGFCSSLTSITIPDSVVSIDHQAFEYCTSLESVKIGKGVVTMGSLPFMCCESLVNIEVDDANQYYCDIDGVLFTKDLTKLIVYPVANERSSYTIPNGVVTIGADAFYYCENLTSVSIPNGVKYIEGAAFAGCKNLESLALPNSVISIAHAAFWYCENLTYIEVAEGNSYFCSVDGVLFNKRMTELLLYPAKNSRTSYNVPDSVTKFEDGAFRDCANLVSITLPESLTRIDSSIFENCTNLESIDIPNKVIFINFDAFKNCIGLKSVTIADSVTNISSSVFEDCTSLVDVKLSTNINSISYNSFKGCINLTNIIIPDGVSDIGSNAFEGCTSLKSITIPNSVTNIGWSAFYNCTDLVNGDVYFNGTEEQWNTITIDSGNDPLLNATIHFLGDDADVVTGQCGDNAYWSFDETSGVLKITGTGAMWDYTAADGDELATTAPWFEYAAKIEKLVVEEGITSIGECAFALLTNLKSFELPSTLKTIGMSAFANCVGLTKIILPDNITTIEDMAFSNCINAEELYLSSSLISIGEAAFENCWSVEWLNLPDSIETIGASAFVGLLKIEKINIPKNIKFIGEWAFAYNTSLKEITVPAEAKAFDYDKGMDVFGMAYALESIENHSSEVVLDQLFELLVDSTEVAETYLYLVGNTYKCDTIYYWKGMFDLGVTVESIFRETIEYLNRDFGTNYNPADYALSSLETYYAFVKEFVEEYLDPHKIENLWYPPYFVITCLEVSEQHVYCRDNRVPHKIFGGGDVLCSCAGEDECAHVVETIPAVDPTCTTVGSTAGEKCSLCEKTIKEIEEIPALGHLWGDWVVIVEPTVAQQGKKIRTCERCGETETKLIDRLEIDWENDENYGKANFTVVDAETLEPIGNAWINIFTEEGETSTFITDSNGKVSIVLPIGEVKFAAGAVGKRIRNLKYNITHAEIDVPTIALSSEPLIDVAITSKEMTREEIIDAGIDISDPDNYHVVKYTVIIEYEGEKKITEYYVNNGGEHYYPDGPYIEIGDDILYFTEKFYLIIKGQVSWLKQMFEVEMRVYNNSPFDTFEEAQATLILPEGLSLADMVDGEQSFTQNLGTVAENSETSCKWYVRGDKAGTYSISANLKGVLMPFEEEFDHTYVTDDPIKVYDENAIKLYVRAPEKVVCGEEFSVIVGVENISDITLYNMLHIFTGLAECYVRHYSNGKILAEFYAYDPIGMGKFAEEFKPGDRLELEYKSSILLNSDKIKNTIFNLVDIVIIADNVKTEIENNFGYHDEHSMGEYTVTKPATCTEPGTQVAKCKHCGYETTEEIPAKGHIDDNDDNYCDVCGELLSDSDNDCDRYGHDYKWITKTAATCTEDGEEIYICQREDCGAVNDSRVIPALGHEPFEYGVPATCTVNGYKFITCARCYADLDYIILEKTGHISGTYIKDQKEATCTEDGYTGDVCCVSCNMKLESGTIIEKLGHDAVVHTQNALCTTNGFTITVCARCYDLLDYIIINRLGHDMGTPESNDNGTHTSECQRSGCEYSETYDCTYGEWEIITESTCVAAGEKSRACTECGYAETEELPLADHIPGKVVVENNIEPECEEMGQYDNVIYCSVCGEELSRETVKVDSLGHDWDDGEVIKTASCTVKEEIVYTCKRNSAHVRIEVGDVDRDNHIGGTYIDNQKDATCTEEGYSGDTYCSDCKIKLASGTIINKLEHNPIEYVQSESCTTNGYKITICSLCYELLGYETFIKLGHNMGDFESNDDGTHTSECQRDICTYAETYDCTFGEWVTTLESTCTAEGEKSRICTVCGYAETETLPLTEHIPGTVVVENNVAPKCEEEGSYDNVVYCTVCNEELSRETVVVDKLGHNWDNASITKVATCIIREEILYTCLNDASHTRIEVGNINPDNHTGDSYYVEKKDATCTEAGYTGDAYCADCQQKVDSGVVIDMLGHDMGEWVTVKEATLLEDGKSEKYCSRCTYTETQLIPRKTGEVSEDQDSGVSVEYPKDAYDEDIEVDVKEEFDGSQFLTQQYTNVMAWNIKTYIGGEEVQPKVPVLVRIPIPADYNDSAIAVFHINSNTGVRERIEPVIVENGYISFIATSFSVYIMVDESSEIHNHKDDNHDGKCDGCDYDFTSGCSCRCHKTGIIAKFIWKITIFFNKILRRNKVCACGIYHY